MTKLNRYISILAASLLLILTSCEKLLEVPPPKARINSDAVFEDDITAQSAVRGIYVTMLDYDAFSSGTNTSVTALCGQSADELVDFPRYSPDAIQFDENDLRPENEYVRWLWTSMYKIIYQANAVLEGLETSQNVSTSVKAQLQGEALFIRAFTNFYLVNLFGKVPLVMGTDYEVNAKVTRTAIDVVYGQIEADLLAAQGLLKEAYPAIDDFRAPERVHPNKYAAHALLARVYLFRNEWAKAEVEATKVIEREDVYKLPENLDDVFLASSKEAIWQLKQSAEGYNTYEALYFVILYTPPYNVLHDDLYNAFTGNDQRLSHWIGDFTTETGVVHYPFKYKEANYNAPLTEYSVVMRLAEQFLIRAEARARQNNIDGAQEDLDEVRGRAGLNGTTAADMPSLLEAVEQERRLELFTEWGHRWLDLKRTSRATAVLSPLKPEWNAEDVLYPIPQSELNKNPYLKEQNAGY